MDNKDIIRLCWPPVRLEHIRDCYTIGEVYGNSKSANLSFNVDDNRQESSSQSNQNNGITISNRKNTQNAEFSVVTPEQSQHIKPVDRAIISMIPQGGPDLTAYLNEILRTKKSEQQYNTCWSPTPENIGKPKVDTPIHTRIQNWINWSQRERKTQSTRGHGILKQTLRTIWLDWHSSNRNREGSNWRYFGWLSWPFCHTQKG